MTRAEDIRQFAKNALGYEILPHQIKMIEAALDGQTIIGGKRIGKATARKIALAYMNRDKV